VAGLPNPLPPMRDTWCRLRRPIHVPGPPRCRRGRPL